MGERFVFSWLKTTREEDCGQRMLLNMSEPGFGLCQRSKAGSLSLAAEMGWLGEDAEPCLSFPSENAEEGSLWGS